jgi:hypothetical protein
MAASGCLRMDKGLSGIGIIIEGRSFVRSWDGCKRCDQGNRARRERVRVLPLKIIMT